MLKLNSQNRKMPKEIIQRNKAMDIHYDGSYYHVTFADGTKRKIETLGHFKAALKAEVRKPKIKRVTDSDQKH